MRKSKEELAKGSKLTLWQASLFKAVDGLGTSQRGMLLNCILSYLTSSPYSCQNEDVIEHFKVLLADFEAEKIKEADKSKKRSLSGALSHSNRSNVPNGTSTENDVPNGTNEILNVPNGTTQKTDNVPNGTENKGCICVESLFENQDMYQMVHDDDKEDVPNGTKNNLKNNINNILNNNLNIKGKKDKKEINKERNESQIDPNVPFGTSINEIPIGGHGVVNGKVVYKRRTGLVFIEPTIEEVESYIKEKGYHFDAKFFIDYYSADDWRYGEKRIEVSSWKRCCATFENTQLRMAGRSALSKQTTKRTINAHENINTKNYEQF